MCVASPGAASGDHRSVAVLASADLRIGDRGADALVWEGANKSLLEVGAGKPDFAQYLVRALIYRLVTDSLSRANHGHLRAVTTRTNKLVTLACEMASTTL
jgi:hypothetical protein